MPGAALGLPVLGRASPHTGWARMEHAGHCGVTSLFRRRSIGALDGLQVPRMAQSIKELRSGILYEVIPPQYPNTRVHNIVEGQAQGLAIVRYRTPFLDERS